MRTPLALALVTLVSTGCVTTNIERLSPVSYPPTSPESVTVFMDPGELRSDSIHYERLAMIFTSGSSELTSNSEHLRKARQEAAKLGANGLVVQSREAGGRHNWFWGTSSPRESSVMAIRWWTTSAPAAPSVQRVPPADAEVSAVTLEPAVDTLQVGERRQIVATARGPSGGPVAWKSFRWSSSNDAIASVDNAGLVTAHAAGAVVVAANAGGVVGTCSFVVVTRGQDR